jgi:hypothetical protein
MENVDKEQALRVVPIREKLERCASDALKALWSRENTDATDVVVVGRVLPAEPTDHQFDDLAVRWSNAVEDFLSLALGMGAELRVLSTPMGIPILDRRELRQRADAGHSLFDMPEVTGRELLCVFYMVVPTWRGWERAGMVAKLAEVARPHGVWCGDPNAGGIPPLEES